jgi:hypothetical protein
LNWFAASRTTAVADIARPKRYDARSRSRFCRCSPDAPFERVLIAAAASLSPAVYSYPLLFALPLLRVTAQGFQ